MSDLDDGQAATLTATCSFFSFQARYSALARTVTVQPKSLYTACLVLHSITDLHMSPRHIARRYIYLPRRRHFRLWLCCSTARHSLHVRSSAVYGLHPDVLVSSPNLVESKPRDSLGMYLAFSPDLLTICLIALIFMLSGAGTRILIAHNVTATSTYFPLEQLTLIMSVLDSS